MIIDKLSNASFYYRCHPLFEEAFQFIEKCIKENYREGRYDISGEELYALVSEYLPAQKENPRYEAHEKYIDIQVIAEGSEAQWYAPVDSIVPCSEYDIKKDICFYLFNNNGNKLDLNEKMFAVYFPQDGHLPKMYNGNDNKCKRIVVKVKC